MGFPKTHVSPTRLERGFYPAESRGEIMQNISVLVQIKIKIKGSNM